MNELERILNLAGVSYEAPKKIEETTEIAEDNPNYDSAPGEEAAKAARNRRDDDQLEQDYQANRQRKKRRIKDLISNNPASEFSHMYKEDDLDEAPNEGNEFSGNRKAAIDAGEDEFEVDGKKYKVSGNKNESIEEDEEQLDEEQSQAQKDAFAKMLAKKKGDKKDTIDHEKQHVKEDDVEEIVEAEEGKMPSKAEVMKCCEDGMSEAEICKKYPDCDQEKLKEMCKDCKAEMNDVKESLEVVEESPTMDTTQLITLLKNSGISEDQIANRLKIIEEEFGNTPEGVGETEPTVHGSDDNYNFAQAVNLSLKRYLDAHDMKVSVTEHTKEDLTAKYLASKK